MSSLSILGRVLQPYRSLSVLHLSLKYLHPLSATSNLKRTAAAAGLSFHPRDSLMARAATQVLLAAPPLARKTRGVKHVFGNMSHYLCTMSQGTEEREAERKTDSLTS